MAKKYAREIELRIPVEIYNQILDKVEQLREETERKISELRKFEENLLKVINEDRERNRKSIEKFEKGLRDYIEKKNIMTFKDLRSKIEKSLSELNKKQEIIELSVKKNFEKEGQYVSNMLKDMDRRIDKISETVSEIKKSASFLSKEIQKTKKENDKLKKDIISRDKKIRKLEEEIKSIKEGIKDIKKDIKDKFSIYEHHPLKLGLKKIESKQKKKPVVHIEKDRRKVKEHESTSLLQKILPFVKSGQKKESKIEKKIENIRRRKKGREYIVAIAHTLRDFMKKKYDIKEQLTYNELIQRIEKMKEIPKDVREQLVWFFKEVQEHEYSGELNEAYFPDLDKWAKKVIELLE